jgi:hypothetical protein
LPVSAASIAQIERRLARCDAVIAIVGPHWIDNGDTSSASSGSASGATADIVRAEIGLALELGLPIVIALVDGASAPDAASLPASLAPLARMPALPIRPSPHLRADLATLLDRVSALTG